MPLSTTLSGKSIRYTSTSVPSLARLRRLLEAGNSARYLRTSWGRVRNPCQKIARSEDYKSSKIFICKLQYPPEHSWNKVSGNIIRKVCMAWFLLDFPYLIRNILSFLISDVYWNNRSIVKISDMIVGLFRNISLPSQMNFPISFQPEVVIAKFIGKMQKKKILGRTPFL